GSIRPVRSSLELPHPMTLGTVFNRTTAALCTAVVVIASSPSSPLGAQSVPPLDRSVTYVLPQWPALSTASRAGVQQQVQELRTRLGADGRRVRLGFATYISITMKPVDPANAAAVRTALEPVIAQMDAIIERPAPPTSRSACRSSRRCGRMWMS